MRRTGWGFQAPRLAMPFALLEDRLGAKLLNRTTRSVAPTAAGERLLARLRPALQDIGDGLEELADEHAGPSGLVRINTHHSAAALYVVPKLKALRQTYPGITLDITTNEGLVDIVSAGYDAGIPQWRAIGPGHGGRAYWPRLQNGRRRHAQVPGESTRHRTSAGSGATSLPRLSNEHVRRLVAMAVPARITNVRRCDKTRLHHQRYGPF